MCYWVGVDGEGDEECRRRFTRLYFDVYVYAYDYVYYILLYLF